MNSGGFSGEKIWEFHLGNDPFIATAVHDGHDVRDDVASHLELSDSQRLREEDPFTGEWTKVAPTRVVGTKSRFQVDLNRPRDKAVYRTPDDAWGLSVWKDNPPEEVFERSLAEYDAFYDASRKLFDDMVKEHGRFLVFDLHTYNHRRDGADGPIADPQANPQVNIGTGSIDRQRWGSVIDTLIETLASYDFPGGKLDVRENVKFQGGNWPRWIHQQYPETGIAIAIEFKKFFMDEWTGLPDENRVKAIGDALRFTAPEVLKAFKLVR